jgi:4'-phosphopantetheinyl transferase
LCYAIDLQQPAPVVERASTLLDAREHVNADARRGDAARRYVVAHGALREILAAHAGVSPDAIRFRYRCAVCGSNEHGRPELDAAAHRDAPSFSLSHSQEVAVVAVVAAGSHDRGGDEQRVGVDVETRRARHNLDRLAIRALDDEELERWRALPPADQLTAFLVAWTAKEAYLKLLGVGLTRRLRDVPTNDAQTWVGWPTGCVTSVVAATRGPFTTVQWIP